MGIPPERVHQEMGLAGWFGDSVAAARPQNDRARPLEAHPITGGDVDRFDSVPGTEDHPDPLPFMVQNLRTPSVLPWLTILPHQEALRAADRWQVEQQAEVAGEPEPAGMCDPLSIAEKTVGTVLEPLESF